MRAVVWLQREGPTNANIDRDNSDAAGNDCAGGLKKVIAEVQTCRASRSHELLWNERAGKKLSKFVARPF